MGPSGSGKSTIKNLFSEYAKENPQFGEFVSIEKYSTRESRGEEDIGEIIHCEKIPANCKIKYESYGERYGIPTDEIEQALAKGINPVVVVNDKGAINDMVLADMPLVTLYVYREPPNEKEFLSRESARNSVSKKRTDDQVSKDSGKRFQKARDVDRTRIENPNLFDEMILNTGTLDQTRNQLFNVLDGTNNERRSLLADIKELWFKNKPKLFIFAGGGDMVGEQRNNISGKDAIIKSIFRVYDRKADVVPKMTTRAKKDDDTEELICQYIPDANGGFVENPGFDMANCDIIYERVGRNDGIKYGINTEEIKQGLKNGKHQCVSVTNVDTIKNLIDIFGEDTVSTVYIHSYRGKRADGQEDFGIDSHEAFDIYNKNTRLFNYKFLFDGVDTDSLLNQLSNLFGMHSIPDRELRTEFGKYKRNPILEAIVSVPNKLTKLKESVVEKLIGQEDS